MVLFFYPLTADEHFTIMQCQISQQHRWARIMMIVVMMYDLVSWGAKKNGWQCEN